MDETAETLVKEERQIVDEMTVTSRESFRDWLEATIAKLDDMGDIPAPQPRDAKGRFVKHGCIG